MLSLSHFAALLTSTYVIWTIFRRFVIKTSLSDIPGPPKDSWWKGNFHRVFDAFNGWEYHRSMLEKYGGVVKLSMLFGDEQLYVSDPLALHHIVVKDQYAYEETDMFTTSNKIVFGTSLFSTRGDQHRKQRKMLNPVFSQKHIRGLLPIFQPIADDLHSVFERQIRDGQAEIDILKWVSRSALECMGQGGLGHEFHALDDKQTDTYVEAIRMLGPASFKLFLPRQILPYVAHIGSPKFRRKVVQMIPSKLVKAIRDIVDVMDEHAQSIYYTKKRAVEEGDDSIIGGGKDIMSVLLKANMAANSEDALPDSELLGQVNTLIFAGHETTAGAITRTLQVLAMHVEAQDRLRDEIKGAFKEHGETLDYDTLMALPYLDAVIRETLRLFPPVAQLNRTTMNDIALPLLWPIKSVSGKEIKEIPIRKNTNVIVSIMGANRRKEIWGEDADEWKPKRWLEPLPESVANARLPGVYGSTMSFLGGGRACIGFKFAEMEMKLTLATLLKSFTFAPGPEIHWAMSLLQAPFVKGSGSLTPQLPLKDMFNHSHLLHALATDLDGPFINEPSKPVARITEPRQVCLAAGLPFVDSINTEQDMLTRGRAELLRQLSRIPSPAPSLEDDEILVEKDEAGPVSGASAADNSSSTSLVWLSSKNKNQDKRWKEPQLIEVFSAIDRKDDVFLMEVRDRAFHLLLKTSDKSTPLVYSMNLGESHRQITIFLLGALSRWCNRLTDADLTDKTTKSLLKALRTNLRLAINCGLELSQSDLIASFMQILIMSEGDRWILLQAQLIALALRNGPAGNPVRMAEATVRTFTTRELGQAGVIASLEDYIANAAADLLILGVWSCALETIHADALPISFFARDNRLSKAFQERVDKHRKELGLLDVHLRRQVEVLESILEGRSLTYREKMKILRQRLDDANDDNEI